MAIGSHQQDGPQRGVVQTGHHHSVEVRVHPVEVPAGGVDGQIARIANARVDEHLQPCPIQVGPLDGGRGLSPLLDPVDPIGHDVVGDVIGVGVCDRDGDQVVDLREGRALPKVKGEDPDL